MFLHPDFQVALRQICSSIFLSFFFVILYCAFFFVTEALEMTFLDFTDNLKYWSPRCHIFYVPFYPPFD